MHAKVGRGDGGGESVIGRFAAETVSIALCGVAAYGKGVVAGVICCDGDVKSVCWELWRRARVGSVVVAGVVAVVAIKEGVVVYALNKVIGWQRGA